VKIENVGSSTSIMVPGSKPLQYRTCLEDEELSLLVWFATVERHAREYVNALFGTRRPSSIFLVVGQTLATEYATCHLRDTSSSCEVAIEPSINFAEIANASIALGYGLRSVSASLRFQVQQREEHSLEPPPWSSVYLQVHESFPIKRLHIILGTLLYNRLDDMFKCSFVFRYRLI
jgi:hypothetical protein